MVLVLRRVAPTADGVFGTLDVDGAFTLATVEDDWKDNAPGESCIPPGPGPAEVVYQMRRSWYYRGGYEAFEIMHVPGRSRILIHIANTEEDVKGCIGVGLRHGTLVVPRDEDTGQTHVEMRSVVASREAFRRLMEALANVDHATLKIGWA